MTGDDRGGLTNVQYNEQKMRARQNVIFELGFFVGALRRDRVCALYEDGVELPSDYDGIAYIRYDDEGAWRLSLARELQAANVPISLEHLVGT